MWPFKKHSCCVAVRTLQLQAEKVIVLEQILETARAYCCGGQSWEHLRQAIEDYDYWKAQHEKS